MTAGHVGMTQVQSYLEAARNGDGDAADEIVATLLEAGVPFETMVTGCLGAAQTLVGEHWLSASWSVADEHLATAVVQRSLNTLVSACAASAAGVAQESGHIVAACAEGDWHALPAQMFTELLRVRGFRVSFLGASTPAAHVRRLLSRTRADALVVSCATALYYPGVSSLAQAAHEYDVPVLAGGRAIGDVPERALGLGADAGATGIDDAVAILRSWVDVGRIRRTDAETVASGATSDPMAAPQVVEQVHAELGRDFSRLAVAVEEQGESLVEVVEHVVGFLHAARRSGDAAVFLDFVGWLGTFVACRRLPGEVLRATLAAVATVVEPSDPAAARLVVRGLELPAVRIGPTA